MIPPVQQDFECCSHVLWRNRNKRVLVGRDVNLKVLDTIFLDECRIFGGVFFRHKSPELVSYQF